MPYENLVPVAGTIFNIIRGSDCCSQMMSLRTDNGIVNFAVDPVMKFADDTLCEKHRYQKDDTIFLKDGIWRGQEAYRPGGDYPKGQKRGDSGGQRRVLDDGRQPCHVPELVRRRGL